MLTFSELRATVATLHRIERKRKITVFDMGLTVWQMGQGLTAWQMGQVGTWADTDVVKLFEYTAKSALLHRKKCSFTPQKELSRLDPRRGGSAGND